MRQTMRILAAATATVATAALYAGPAEARTNDPLYDQQYGPQQVRAEQAWNTSTGKGAVIAVVDSGVALSHPDLKGKLVRGATFVDCAASCGNGNWKGPDGEGDAPDTHGTHVSGIAAAATGNGVGIAGVARAAKIMPIKVCSRTAAGPSRTSPPASGTPRTTGQTS